MYSKNHNIGPAVLLVLRVRAHVRDGGDDAAAVDRAVQAAVRARARKLPLAARAIQGTPFYQTAFRPKSFPANFLVHLKKFYPNILVIPVYSVVDPKRIIGKMEGQGGGEA
jgi:hypothetical protein